MSFGAKSLMAHKDANWGKSCLIIKVVLKGCKINGPVYDVDAPPLRWHYAGFRIFWVWNVSVVLKSLVYAFMAFSLGWHPMVVFLTFQRPPFLQTMRPSSSRGRLHPNHTREAFHSFTKHVCEKSAGNGASWAPRDSTYCIMPSTRGASFSRQLTAGNINFWSH